MTDLAVVSSASRPRGSASAVCDVPPDNDEYTEVTKIERRRRERRQTLSRIDPSSEDGIRSFLIETGRIHASRDPPEVVTRLVHAADPIQSAPFRLIGVACRHVK